MQISISARHGHLSDVTRAKITAKVEKLARLFDRLQTIEVTIDLEHEETPTVDILVSAIGKHDFVATESGGSLMGALDGTIHKLEQSTSQIQGKGSGPPPHAQQGNPRHGSRQRRRRSLSFFALVGRSRAVLRLVASSAVPSLLALAKQPRREASPLPAQEPGGRYDGGRQKGTIKAMKFSDFVSAGAIRANLHADDKQSAIHEMVDALCEAGKITREEVEGIVKAILKREELGSTGIGRGVAVPHTKHASVQRLVGTVAVSPEGIDFNSLDGEKVNLFFLLISPPDRPGDHLRALENISRQLRDDTFCKFLKQAKSADDIRQLLEEADDNRFFS